MVKKPEDYRGEDKTLELIRERANELFKHPESIHASFETAWDQACEQLEFEMRSNGLHSTAKEIMKHHGVYIKNPKIIIIPENVEKWKFASGGTLSLNPDDRRSLVGESGPEAIMPPRNSNH